MSDYETRRAAERAKEAADMDRFETVLQAGADAGLWRVVPIAAATGNDVSDRYRRAWRYVETDAGRFSISKGRGATVEARVAAAGADHGVQVRPSDLHNPGAVAPTATAALAREPLTIARDLYRRVCVAGADDARRMRALLAERQATREQLLQHVAALKAQGAEVPSHMSLSASEYYEARAWVQGLFGTIRVTAAGKVYVERVTVKVADLPALREMVGRAE
jgi:hypothetical protein